MDTDSIEKEIASSIREILLPRGVDESQIKIKAKTKTTSAEMPVRAQGVEESKDVGEWPKAVVEVVKMKLSVEFVAPESD